MLSETETFKHYVTLYTNFLIKPWKQLNFD